MTFKTNRPGKYLKSEFRDFQLSINQNDHESDSQRDHYFRIPRGSKNHFPETMGFTLVVVLVYR